MPTGTIKMNKPPPPAPVIGPPPKSTKYKGVKHTIMVMSGKGGVGKSTVSVNLSVTLAKKYRVGLIDADINGPDDPKMLGVSDAQLEADENGIIPVHSKYGVDVISMGFLLPSEDTAVIWRGALRHKAIQQFLEDVAWGERDFIILDMPPGTGDEGLTVAQLVPEVEGVIIVVTPQDVALLDAKKAINFAQQMKIPVLGIIENMSGFVCPHCGERVDIFKSGGGEESAAKYRVPFLGRIPLIPQVVKDSDDGIPSASSSEVISKVFSEITGKLLKAIEKKDQKVSG